MVTNRVPRVRLYQGAFLHLPSSLGVSEQSQQQLEQGVAHPGEAGLGNAGHVQFVVEQVEHGLQACAQ